MYADDTSLMCKAKNVDDLKVQLESNLQAVAKWFKANKLTLNADKTKFMVLEQTTCLTSLMILL